MIYSYLRVSTNEQDTNNQWQSIADYVATRGIKIDHKLEFKVSSRQKREKRGIDELLQEISRGDTLIVSELSRLGRSTISTLDIIEELLAKGVKLVFVKQSLEIDPDKRDPFSDFTINLFAALAQMERDQISARTKEALLAKKRAGHKLGRPAQEFSRSKYDRSEKKIVDLLNMGVSRNKILSMHLDGEGTAASLNAWIKKRYEYSGLLGEWVQTKAYREYNQKAV